MVFLLNSPLTYWWCFQSYSPPSLCPTDDFYGLNQWAHLPVASGFVQSMGNPRRRSESRFRIFIQSVPSVVSSGSDFITLAEVTNLWKEFFYVQLSFQFCQLPVPHHFRPKDPKESLLALVFSSFPYTLSLLLKLTLLWNILSLSWFKYTIYFLFATKNTEFMILLDYLKLASQILGDTGTQRKGRKGKSDMDWAGLCWRWAETEPCGMVDGDRVLNRYGKGIQVRILKEILVRSLGAVITLV